MLTSLFEYLLSVILILSVCLFLFIFLCIWLGVYVCWYCMYVLFLQFHFKSMDSMGVIYIGW